MRPTPEELVNMSPLDRALSLVHEFKFMAIGMILGMLFVRILG
jgi:hypothetical protein